MKNWLQEYYGFSKREFNGIVALLFVVLSINFIPCIYDYFFRKEPKISVADRKAFQQLAIVDRYPKRNFDEFEDKSWRTNKKPISYHNFDPNLSDTSEWKSFGLSSKQARAVVNYVNRGGRFYKPEDLKKMFVISPEKYSALLPYVKISSAALPDKQYTPYEKKVQSPIELNTADTVLFDKIRGVGPSFARRIATYRDRLGGFYKKEQLLEVWGLDSAKYQEIKDQVSLDPGAIKMIKINTVEFEDLKTHPYLRYKEMNAIVQYRKQHGPYRSVDDLRKILILSPQSIARIAPYLSFEYDQPKN